MYNSHHRLIAPRRGHKERLAIKSALGLLLSLAAINAQAATCVPSDANGFWRMHFPKSIQDGSTVRMQFNVSGGGTVNFTSGGWARWSVTVDDVIVQVEDFDVTSGSFTVDTACLVQFNININTSPSTNIRTVSHAAMSDDGQIIFGIIQGSDWVIALFPSSVYCGKEIAVA